MIVKKLGMVSGGGFPGAGYNERKVAEGVTQLMAMENVDAAMRHKVELLHEAGLDCAGEIEKYLKERSRTYGNTKTTRFQFHITASVKGQVMSAEELTAKLTGSTILPLRQSDYTPEQAKAFTAHQCTVLARLIPRDTSSTHSANREWEVGKQSRYDHIDNQQSGTKLTM